MRWIVGVVPCVLASLALGQADEPSPWERSRLHDWTISLEARAWYPAPSGDLTLPGGSALDDAVDLADVNMDSPRVIPYGEIRLQRGKWQIGLAASTFSAEASAVMTTTRTLGAVPTFAGETTHLDFSHWSFETRGLYQLFSYVDGSTADGRDRVRIRGLAGAGVRASAVDVDFRVVPTSSARTGAETLSVSYEGTFVELMAAGALEIDLSERWFISVEASGAFSGLDDRTSSSFSIEPTFAWHPTPNLGVEVGYRMLIHRMEEGPSPSDFEWAGSLAGIFGGVSLRF